MGVNISGGALRGARIKTPQGIRPTQAHVRRSVFDRIGNTLPGGRMVDLFAGSGAVGIEALSRGAEFAVFVERNRASARILRENIRDMGLTDRTRLVFGDVQRAVTALWEEDEIFDWGFADPPYGFKRLRDKLGGLWGIISEGGLFILEVHKKDTLPHIVGFELEEPARLRDVQLGFYRRVPGEL